MRRWRGLKDLVQDMVDQGSRSVERLQKETAKRPFELLEQVPSLEVPVKGIREIHDTAISSVHEMIRLVNRVTGSTLDVILDAVEQTQAKTGDPAAERTGAPGEPAGDPADKTP
jgi:hypothetical protein